MFLSWQNKTSVISDSVWNLRKKTKKYIDKIFKEKVGKWLKSELF